MSYLFIDSTYDLSLGVLNDELQWLSFERKPGQKASAIIQSSTHEILSTHNLHPEDLKGIITVNGPGFYTGLRLAEGFSDVFKFFGVPQFSFYSYEIPLWCGYKKGVWFTKAYKGEYFFYRWNNETSSTELLSSKQLEGAFGEEQFFIHSSIALDALSAGYLMQPIETNELLKTRPREIFSHVIKGLQREPYYFRAPEDEFKANP